LAATAQHQPYIWTTTNLLLTTGAYPGVTGVKTGFTGNAGGCLVFSAQQGTHELLGVVLGEPSDPGDTARFTDAAALLTWGFRLEQQGL
jgi:D-alanyl-D-alanine carboxypeptidase (penicillin-binding protein 5/6)